jgi:hypothetical protein
MPRSRTVIVSALLAGLMVLAGQAPAFAPWRRASDEGINILEACRKHLKVEVARARSVPEGEEEPKSWQVRIQAFSPPLRADFSVPSGAKLVLNKKVTLPLLARPKKIEFTETDSLEAHYLGKFELKWSGGRKLARGTKVTVVPVGILDNPPGENAGQFTVKVPYKCD